MDYVTAIGLGFPNTQVHCFGDPFVYENVQWVSGNPMPSKQALDQWIAANTNINRTKLTVFAFRNRFTQGEKIAIELSSLDNPTAPMAQRQLAAKLRVYMADLHVATFVDVSHPDARAGVTELEQYGIIGPGRALQILDTPPTAVELSPFN